MIETNPTCQRPYDSFHIAISDLNILRAFAIVLVVLRHCFSPYTGAWEVSELYEYNRFTDILGKYIATISMPLFVFISGFLFSYLRNNLKKYSTYPVLLRKKTARLIRPYLILAPIYIYFFLDFYSLNEFLFHFWKGAGHLWFLLMIFTTFLIFYKLETFFKNNPLKSLVIILFLFFLFPVFSRLGLYPIAKSVQYFPYFFIGYFFYHRSADIIRFLNNKVWALFLCHTLIFIVSVMVPKYLEIPEVKVLFKSFILLPMGIISVSLLFVFFTRFKQWNTSRASTFVKNINEKSYYIYLIHQPLLMLLFEIKILQEWHPLQVIPLVFVFTMALSLILSSIFMQFALGKKLIGA